jgi:hypothetical protein
VITAMIELPLSINEQIESTSRCAPLSASIICLGLTHIRTRAHESRGESQASRNGKGGHAILPMFLA